eukprot:8008662-Karenia_brevis.AAC.1
MVLYPLAGQDFTGDVSAFERMGITVDYSCNVKFMQVPMSGMRASSRTGWVLRWALSSGCWRVFGV